jgi:geranylgeranyl transferase type-2 subunit alpha
LEQRARDAVRISELQTLMNKVHEHKAKSDDALDESTLALCTQVLEVCTEYYTVWNLRKRVLLVLFQRASDPQAAFVAEMRFGKHAIARSPKSYWSWAHRKWLLSDALAHIKQAPIVVDWSVELGLCAQLLDLDQRNFHCWSYRRFIAERNPGSTLDAELQFTRTKIDQNFSNYSAWHQRSLLLTRMHSTGAELTAALAREFELIQQAYYTEPEDQSAWVYHRWLVCKTLETESNEVICATLRAELRNCNELLDVEPNSKWAMLTSVFLLRQLLTHDAKANAGAEREVARERLQRLRQLDPQRGRFYENELKLLA